MAEFDMASIVAFHTEQKDDYEDKMKIIEEKNERNRW